MITQTERKALVLYYTCSENTKKLAKEVEKAIGERGWQVESASLRSAQRDKIRPERLDFIVLGTPVQYFTVPEAALIMIRKLPEFSGTPAFVFSTYGGCVTSNVPYMLARELSNKGAKIIGGAQLLTPHSCRIDGKHTIGSQEEAFGKGRPNKEELDLFKGAIALAAQKIERSEETSIDLNRLKINTMTSISACMNSLSSLKMKRYFMPHVEIIPERCTGCKKCSTVCDSGSIYYDEDGSVLSDRSKCVKCYACIEQCREGALTINWKLTEMMVRAMNKIAKKATAMVVS